MGAGLSLKSWSAFVWSVYEREKLGLWDTKRQKRMRALPTLHVQVACREDDQAQ